MHGKIVLKLHMHKLISRDKAFLIEAVRTFVIAEQPYQTMILGHDDKHIAIRKFIIQLLMDNGQHSLIFAMHIVKPTQIIEAVQTDYAQHKDSNFSTKPGRPS